MVFMLLTKEVEVNLCSANIEYYEKLGYKIPRRIDKKGRLNVAVGTKINVLVEHLTENSSVYVDVQCDYCGIIENKKYNLHYQSLNNSVVKKDCCPKCQPIKNSEGYKIRNPQKEQKVKSIEIKKKIVKRHKPEFFNEVIKQNYKENYGENYDFLCKSGIYQIRNVVNNKVYIGSTFEFRKRKTQHFADLRNNRHYNEHLQRAFNKYGEENFKFEIIEIIEDKNILEEKEKYYIDSFFTYDENNGYNVSIPGRIQKYKGMSEETKEKLRQANIGKKLSEEHKQKIGNANRGRKRSKEYCDMMSEMFKGKKRPPEVVEKMKGNNAGSKNGNAKLTEEDVLEIRKLLLKGEKKIKIAKMYNVTDTLIGRIAKNKTWKHIQLENI